ncbi:GNAT family N-acetyltransferase [Streptomyces sp. NPDC048521]|uniref:GNAT family N-acetyltransferase n=1 Tax=Streptomyces sp. NPDC048521 TaxID=3365566 RepID=UPI00371B441D
MAAPGLSGRDRIAVAGAAQDAVPLVREVWAEVGPAYRPFGRAELIDAVVRAVPGLEYGGPPFWWMETAQRPGAATRAQWLDGGAEAEAVPLFERYFPESYAQPGRPGVRRWAGVHGEAAAGERGLPAVAADAWSGAGCGFVAGVLTHPAARGRGLGVAVSRFVVDALVREFGRAALMVDVENGAAVAAYERVGMRRVPFRAASASPAA